MLNCPSRSGAEPMMSEPKHPTVHSRHPENRDRDHNQTSREPRSGGEESVKSSGSSMRILTGADRGYFRELCQLLLSARRHGVLHRCRVFDLGLSSRQRRRLEELFHPIDIRTFPFDAHPPHVRMAARSYAWKPIILAESMIEDGCPVLWLDSATVIHSDLEDLRRKITRDSQYVPISGGRDSTVERWTHQATLERLSVPPGDPLRQARQRAGGVCGFDPTFPLVLDLVLRWRDLALDAGCIVPPGSNRSNHRQDQAILTILLLRAARDRGLVLTPEEIDVGSAAPIPCLSARNKVPGWMPLFLDPILRRYFWHARKLDVLTEKALRSIGLR